MSFVRPFAVAVAFLTRLPVTVREIRDADFGRALSWFPAVGLLLGGTLAVIAQLGRGHISVELLALAVVAVLAALTGGLHLDGVADVFDGIAGGRGDRERTLAIMRDSRIGAFGAMALVFAVLAKVFAIASVVRTDASWALWTFPVAARWAVCPLVVCFPYARKEGLGRPFNGHARLIHLVLGTALASGVLAFAGAQTVAPAIAALAAAFALALWIQRRLGGLTGDVYGAAIEVAEIAFLIAASVR